MYFAGKLIDDMDRDELIHVIKYLADDIERLTSPQRVRAFGLGSVEMLKRGEKVA